jgi:hypothetical protein
MGCKFHMNEFYRLKVSSVGETGLKQVWRQIGSGEVSPNISSILFLDVGVVGWIVSGRSWQSYLLISLSQHRVISPMAISENFNYSPITYVDVRARGHLEYSIGGANVYLWVNRRALRLKYIQAHHPL